MVAHMWRMYVKPHSESAQLERQTSVHFAHRAREFCLRFVVTEQGLSANLCRVSPSCKTSDFVGSAGVFACAKVARGGKR